MCLSFVIKITSLTASQVGNFYTASTLKNRCTWYFLTNTSYTTFSILNFNAHLLAQPDSD